MRMPDFFVIGAQKAGTTTLHDWLATQSNVCLPDIKETHYFSDDEKFKQGYDWYIQQFDAHVDEKIMGEVDPDCLFVSGVIDKMTQFEVTKKFIIILREPLKRAYSHYLMSCSRGYETLGFIEALEAEKARMNSGDEFSVNHFSYLSRSLYSSQIAKFQTAFPLSDFYFSRFDDLFINETKEKEFLSICHFIGFEPNLSLIDFNSASNVAYTPRFRMLRDLIYNDKSMVRSLLRPLVILLIPKSTRMKLALKIDAFNRKKTVKKTQKLSNDQTHLTIPQWVRDEIDNDLKELQNITGLNLNSWSGATL